MRNMVSLNTILANEDYAKFTAMCNWVASTCRAGSARQEKCLWASLVRLKEKHLGCAVFGRLYYETVYFAGHRVTCIHYIAGQDYKREIETLRRYFAS